MNEHGIVFNARTGHNHDGVNSAPIDLAAGQVTLDNLSAELLEYLESFLGGGINSIDGDGQLLANVPDCVFTVDDLAPGESATGTVSWVSDAVVKYLGIEMSDPTLCDITFYHTADFTNEEREFKARDCTDKFLWEGVWAHSDNTGSRNVYYRIENTGPATASFTVTLKSSTMVATSAGIGSVGGLDGRPPIELLEALSAIFPVALGTFSYGGATEADFINMLEHWLGVSDLEDINMESLTYESVIRFLGMFIHMIGVGNVAKDFAHYEPSVIVVELDEDGNGGGTFDTPPDHIDIDSLVVLFSQANITGGSPANYFITMGDGSGRTFGYPISADGKGGGATPFVANASGGPDIPFIVSAPGATSGTIVFNLGFRIMPDYSDILFFPVIEP